MFFSAYQIFRPSMEQLQLSELAPRWPLVDFKMLSHELDDYTRI